MRVSVSAAGDAVALVRRKIAKLRGRSVAELWERAGQLASAAVEARGIAATVSEPTDETLIRALAPNATGRSPASLARLHRHFATRRAPAFFDGIRNGASAAELRTDAHAATRERLITAADRIVAGQFDLLGHTGLSFGAPIDWHLDPTTGRRSPRVHWSRIDYLDPDVVGDHKVVWELNRHQHLVVLGRAYQVTGNVAYATAYAEQLGSWMDANPPKQGVNWASSLEVAFRSISWLWALELFRESPLLTPALLNRLLGHLDLHGRHLERYLSTYFSPNTHLTGEALGLFYLGVLLPELRRADRWRTLGWQILERELPRQVHDDGVYFEQATYYHRYTVDIYLHAVLLARANALPVPVAMLDRLRLAVDHLADLTRPDGTIPAIGDDDGGRLLALEQRGPMDVRAALGVAAVVLDRPEYAAVARVATEEVLWLLGPDGYRRAQAACGAPPPARLSRLYPVGGYAIMRDGWGSRANHAVIDGGPLAAKHAGHAHSDALAIALTAFGCPVLVDPGTYTYTGSAAERDRFRHSAIHNTVTVDGESASVPAGPFSWTVRTDVTAEAWWSGTLTDFFVGSHGGFLRLPARAVHRRRVLFVHGGYWVIVDTVLGEGAHEAAAHFHTALGSVVTSASARTAWIVPPCAGHHGRLFFAAAGDVDAVEWGEDWVSPAYGVRGLAPAARVLSSGPGRRDILTALVPVTGTGDVAVRELPCDGGRAVAIDRPGVHDLFVLRRAGIARVGAVELDADAALLRREHPAGRLQEVALFGRGGRLIVDGWSFETAGAAEMSRRLDGWSVHGEGRVVAR